MSLDISYSGGVFSAPQAKSVGTVTAGTETYDIANASYDGVSFSVSAQDTSPQGIFFGDGATKLYVVGNTGNDVNQYSLSTAWDITSASFVQNFSVNSQETTPEGIFFKPDGTKMYICGNSSDSVHEYDLSTAWDISTASFNQSLSVSAQEGAPRAVSFKPDGTVMLIGGAVSDTILQYSLSTAWDISTASYDQSFSIASQETIFQSMFINEDGTSLMLVGQQGLDVNRYSLSTAWDVSTMSYVDNFSVSSQDTAPEGLFFKSDGTKMFYCGSNSDTIYQYSTGTATTLDLSTGNYFSHTPSINTVFAFSNAPASGTAAGFALALTGGNAAETYDIANASYDSVSFSVATQATGPFGMDFKPDGTMFFICDLTTDTIYKYNLSTAWDLSTASYASVSKLVGSPGPVVSPFSVRFKPDGTKMYISDVSSPSTIYEWDLSTAWDITTASYNSVSLNVSSQDNSPLGIFFNNDGTKMYVVGLGTDTIYQYDFTTAWDLSTASYASKSLSVLSQDTTPRSGYLSTSGTTLFVLGAANDAIYKYTLSTADDISTATYDSVSFSVTSQENNPSDFIFKSDGTKMYVVGGTNDTVYQYSTGSTSAATFTYPSSVKFPSGTAPAGPAIDETDVLVFYTEDGGTTYQGFQAGDAMA